MSTSLLPVPSKFHIIPKHYHSDPKIDALTNKIDSHITEWTESAIAIKDYYREDQCPAILLDDLGFIIEAGINSNDPERTKRQKIRTAIISHKQRGTFKNGLKPLLDALTTFDSGIISNRDISEWIMTGDGLTPSSTLWGVFGADDISDDYGVLMNGGEFGFGQAGVIFIDIHLGIDTPQFTTDGIIYIVSQIEGVQTPAYEIVVLGYTDSNGAFILYDEGIIQ